MRAILAGIVTVVLSSAGCSGQPRKPEADRALANPALHWLRDSSRRANIYILAGSRAERRRQGLAAAVDSAVDANLAFLHVPFSGRRLNLFFVGDYDQIKSLGYDTHGAWSVTDEGSAFFIAGDLPPALRHETMHLLSWEAWGPPATAWFSEGLATLASGKCGGFAFDDVAASLRRDGLLVPLDTLWTNFVYRGEPGARHYMQAASLLGYVHRTYGDEKLRLLWTPGARANLAQRLGVDLPTLERDWLAEISTRTPTATWDSIYKATQSISCG